MKKLLIALLMTILLASPVWSGDTTSNGYFYLPAYGASGTSERTSWYNSLVATDAIIQQLVDYKDTDNAATADALSANGSNCPSGQYPLGVDASGAVEGCTSSLLGTVTQVTATSPIISSGGTQPVISISLSNDINGVLFNNSGSFGSSSTFKWDSSVDTLTVTGIVAATTLNSTTVNATTINATTISSDTIEGTGTGISSFVQGLVINDGGTGSNTDDILRVESDAEDKLVLTVPSLNVIRFGDGDTNYLQINQTGIMTAVGSASVPSTITAAPSSTWAERITDETGSGQMVFNNAPTMTSVVVNTSLTIPNGTSASASSAGQAVVDTTDDQFRYYGSAQRVLTYKESKSMYLESPTTADTAIMTGVFLDPVTLLSVNCIADPFDNNAKTVVAEVKECNSTGDSCTATQSRPLQCDNDGDSLTTFNNATLDANDWLSFNVSAVTGSVTGVTFQWGYSIDAE